MPYEVILDGAFPVQGVYAVPPLVADGYVYWSPGDKTIRRVALLPGSRAETVYTGTEELSVRAVGGGVAFFALHGNAGGIGRVNVDGTQANPTWAREASLADSSWLIVGGVLYGGGEVSVSFGQLINPPRIDLYVDGSCVMKPGAAMGACFDVEVDFDTRSARTITPLSQAGASNLGVFASNADSWFLVDGDQSFEGEYRILRVPHGGGAAEVVYTGDHGTGYKYGSADADYLYLLTSQCHRIAIVPLSEPQAAQEQELMLNGNGPCIALLQVDASYAYFDTAHGLVRIKLSDLRGM